MIVTPFNLAGPALVLSARARLEAERANLTNFAVGTRSEGTGLGCSPLSAQPRAALHDRPNDGTDLSRFPDFAPFHPSEVGHD